MLLFLCELKNDNLSYSTINTAKSAISSQSALFNHDIGNNILIKKFMKGIFNKKPSLPKYNCTWDVGVVLRYIQTIELSDNLKLLDLSRKLVTLLALTTGQRIQTLHFLDIRNIECTESYIKIRIGDLLKQSKPNYHLPELYINAYTPDSNLCVVRTYCYYLKRTADIRSDFRLLISTQKPHLPVSKSTIGRWIKSTLRHAGIDMSMFTPHSTRSASTSAVSSIIAIDTVLKTAGWKRECTFRKFYNRSVTNDSTFSQSLLTQSVRKGNGADC